MIAIAGVFSVISHVIMTKQNILHNQTYQNICTDQYTSSMQQRFIRILSNYVFSRFRIIGKEF